MFCYTDDMRNSFSLEELFRALADRTRLRILNLVAEQEICVCYFVQVIDVPQPKISRHLAYLRKIGLVTTRREGKWMHYRLAMPSDLAAAEVLKTTIASFQHDKEMQRDIQQLTKACCGPKSLVQVLGAPLPRHQKMEG